MTIGRVGVSELITMAVLVILLLFFLPKGTVIRAGEASAIILAERIGSVSSKTSNYCFLLCS